MITDNMEKKIFVGQKLWLVEYKLRDNDPDKKPIECTVDSVGNKYFTIDKGRSCKYLISDLWEQNNMNYKNRCYLSLEEILHEREFKSLSDYLKTFFNRIGKIDLSLEQLRQINSIINQSNDNG